MSLFKRKKDKGKNKEKEQPKNAVEINAPKKIGKEKERKTKEIQKSEKIKKQEKGERKELKHGHGEAFKQLIRPVITEKASFLGPNSQYVFEVAPRANKIEIKKAVEKLYGVKPVKVNIINVRGKNVRYGRQWGKLKNWKKAIVTLKNEDKIDVYAGT